MARYAVAVNGIVTSLVEWDGQAPYDPGGTLLPAGSLDIGDALPAEEPPSQARDASGRFAAVPAPATAPATAGVP